MIDFCLLNAGNEFLGIKIFDKDVYKLVLLFMINFTVSFLLVRGIYYSFSKKKKEYLFTFMLVSIMVFFIAFALKGFKFNTGMALGLFAIFGVIRFRTNTIPVKEMAYFFAVIGIALATALSKKMSLVEVAFIDFSILLIAFMMELFLKERKQSKKTDVNNGLLAKEIVYGNLDKVKPANYTVLLADLKSKTGLNILSIEVGTLNLKKGEAKLVIYYTK